MSSADWAVATCGLVVLVTAACGRAEREPLRSDGCGTDAVAAACAVDGGPAGSTDGSVASTSDAPQARLRVAPSLHDFGVVEVGSMGGPSTRFVVSNASGVAVGVPALSITGDFAIADHSCGGALDGASRECFVSVVFRPTSPGSKQGTLRIDATAGGTVMAGLIGTGVSSAIRVQPEMGAFPPTTVGGPPSTLRFTVENVGGGPITDLQIAVAGSDFAEAATPGGCAPSLAAGARCTIQIVFDPKTPGRRSGRLMFAGITGSGSVSAWVDLSGVAQTGGMLRMTPLQQAFATTVGTMSAPVTFKIANIGEGMTGAPIVTFRGPDAVEFVKARDSCLMPLAPGATCEVDVVFKPSSVGHKTVTLQATAMPGGQIQAALSGSTREPMLVIDPEVIEFPPTQVGVMTAQQTILVANDGDAETGTIAVSLAGTEFVITEDKCKGVRLRAGDTCVFSCAFKPGSPGQKMGAVFVESRPGGRAMATLAGAAP